MAMSDSEKRNLQLAQREAFFERLRKNTPAKRATKQPRAQKLSRFQPLTVSDPSKLVKRSLLPSQQFSFDDRMAKVMELRRLKVERFEENRRNNILNERSEYFNPKSGRQRYLGGDQ